MASHEDHLQELARRWNDVADAVAKLKAHWHALAGKHPKLVDQDYGQRLDKATEQHIPQARQHLDQTPATGAGLQTACSVTHRHLGRLVESVQPPELPTELSAKERSDVQALHMTVLATAQNVAQQVDQIEKQANESVIDKIRKPAMEGCNDPKSFATAQEAQGLIDHLKCAGENLRVAAPDPGARVAAEQLAFDWMCAVKKITEDQEGSGEQAVIFATEDIGLHAQLVLACSLLETFVG